MERRKRAEKIRVWVLIKEERIHETIANGNNTHHSLTHKGSNIETDLKKTDWTCVLLCSESKEKEE